MVDTMLSSDCTHNVQLNDEGEKKMAFDANTYYNNYKKEHYKRIPVEIDKAYYSDVLVPAAEAKGIGISTYIKEAIREKIERESTR